MVDQIKRFSFDPQTHKITDYTVKSQNPLFVLSDYSDEKTNKCIDCLKGMEFYFPNPSIAINNNPEIRVDPNISVGTFSTKNAAITLLTGAALGIIGLKYGTTIASYAMTYSYEAIKNAAYSVGSSALNLAIRGIKTVGSFFSFSNRIENTTPTMTEVFTNESPNLENLNIEGTSSSLSPLGIIFTIGSLFASYKMINSRLPKIF